MRTARAIGCQPRADLGTSSIRAVGKNGQHGASRGTAPGALSNGRPCDERYCIKLGSSRRGRGHGASRGDSRRRGQGRTEHICSVNTGLRTQRRPPKKLNATLPGFRLLARSQMNEQAASQRRPPKSRRDRADTIGALSRSRRCSPCSRSAHWLGMTWTVT